MLDGLPISVRRTLPLFCAVLFITSACSTSYQPYMGVGSGFSETLIGPDTYRVAYEGRASTKHLNAFLVYRCADLAIGKGYKLFNIVYGYNSGTQAVAITKFDSNLTDPRRMGWHDARRTLEELDPLLEVPPHEFVSNPRLSFDLGTTDEIVQFLFVVTSIDSHTYRVQLSQPKAANSLTATRNRSKLLDHMLWYRVAQFTVDSGADYFVILSGSGRQGSYSTGWDKNSSHHTYNERSLVLRLFKGEPPAALPSAFLESAGVELHLERFRDRERGRVSARSLEYDIGQNDRSHEASTPKQILFRDPSSLAFRRTPLDLEERLFVRCAQTTLDNGNDYFAFVKEEERIPPWQQNERGDFVEDGYAGGTPVFTGQYGPDMKLDDIRVRIQEFRKGDVLPTGLFVFDARDVIKNIGQQL